MAAASRKRRYLGKLPTLGDREQVFLCDEAIEADIVDGYNVETRRVFFSDVQLITWHRQFSVAGLWIGGGSLAIAILIFAVFLFAQEAIFPHQADNVLFWVLFWVIVAPNIPVFLWFLRPYAYVTVFGKRNRAVMRWHFRHGKSQRTFAELAQLVSAHQEQARAQVARSSQELGLAALPQPPIEVADRGGAAIPQPPGDPDPARPPPPSAGPAPPLS